MPGMKAAPETVRINTTFGGIDEIITQDWYCSHLSHIFVEVEPTDCIGLLCISRIEPILIKLMDLTSSRYLPGGII
jgi:hypothetical protein